MAFKVLLVEDDNNLREIYEARLQAEGYTIVTARDGEEALGVAKAELPDLVISDVMMPRVSGFEMLDILRNTDNLKDVKVIMLTALGQADDKTRANSLGADRYLVKSQVTLEDIVKTAHELLGDVTADPAAAAAPAPSVSPTENTVPPAPVAPAMPSLTVAPEPVTPPAAPNSVVQPAPVPPVVAPAQIITPTPPAIPPSVSPAFSPSVGSQPPVALTPPLTAPEPPAPAPSLPPMPGTAPVATPIPAPLPTPASAPQAPSTSEEQATVDTQINNFVRSAPDSTMAAEPGSSTSQDDAVLADAMHDLAASTPADTDTNGSDATTPAPSPDTMPSVPEPPAAPAVAPAPNPMPPVPAEPVTPPLPVTPEPVTTPAPAEPEDKPEPTGSVLIANKKIIQPLSSDETKPSIHELAAREEANSIANNVPAPGMTPPATTFSSSVPTPPAPMSGPIVGGPGVTPAPQPPQAPPAPSNGFDPNSISL